MMKRYRVIFTVKPGTKLPDNVNVRLNFEEGNTEPTSAQVENILEKDSTGALVPVGLKFTVEVTEPSIDDAIQKAGSFADGIASFISLSSRIGLPVVRQELAYEITHGVCDREFLQFFYEIPADMSRIALGSVDPQFLIELMNRSLEDKDHNRRERIARAGRWYRKGSMSTDVFDRFICYWIGFEALNLPLQTAFNVEQTKTVSGVKAFLHNQALDDTYERAHNLRVDLMHSTKKFELLEKEARNLEAIIGEALRNAILFLVSQKLSQQSNARPTSASVPISVALEGTIYGGDPDALGPPGEHPHLEDSHQIVSTKVDNSGKTERVVRSTFTAKTREGVRLSIDGTRIYGPLGVTGKIMNVEKATGKQ